MVSPSSKPPSFGGFFRGWAANAPRAFARLGGYFPCSGSLRKYLCTISETLNPLSLAFAIASCFSSSVGKLILRGILVRGMGQSLHAWCVPGQAKVKTVLLRGGAYRPMIFASFPLPHYDLPFHAKARREDPRTRMRNGRDSEHQECRCDGLAWSQ